MILEMVAVGTALLDALSRAAKSAVPVSLAYTAGSFVLGLAPFLRCDL